MSGATLVYTARASLCTAEKERVYGVLKYSEEAEVAVTSTVLDFVPWFKYVKER